MSPGSRECAEARQLDAGVPSGGGVAAACKPCRYISARSAAPFDVTLRLELLISEHDDVARYIELVGQIATRWEPLASLELPAQYAAAQPFVDLPVQWLPLTVKGYEQVQDRKSTRLNSSHPSI